MSRLEKLTDMTRARVNALNRLFERQMTEEDDFTIFKLPAEQQHVNGAARLSIKGAPLDTTCRWIVILVGDTDVYLISKEVCVLMVKDAISSNLTNLYIPFNRMIKITPLHDPIDEANLLRREIYLQKEEIVRIGGDNTRLQSSEMRLLDENTRLQASEARLLGENTRLQEESDSLREELKRKRVDDEPVGVRNCRVCGIEYPMFKFGKSKKKAEDDGISKKRPTTRRICHKCRYVEDKETAAKKPKTTTKKAKTTQ